MTHHRKKYKRSPCISGSNERGVSILAPLRGATVGLLILAAVGMFQSTHPCGVRLVDELMRTQNRSVSIHAPLRGATHPLRGAGHKAGVSIHAPLRGATLMLPVMIIISAGFNPRTPAGCDVKAAEAAKEAEKVSIHAPLRGATVYPSSTDSISSVSIHAPLRGATWRTLHRFIRS